MPKGEDDKRKSSELDSIMNLVKNYRRLRQKEKLDTDSLLELFRMLFIMEDYLRYEKPSDNDPKMVAVKKTIKNYSYNISSEDDDVGVVKFPAEEGNYTLEPKDLYEFLRGSEMKIIEILGERVKDEKHGGKWGDIEDQWKRMLKVYESVTPMQETDGVNEFALSQLGSLGDHSTNTGESSSERPEEKPEEVPKVPEKKDIYEEYRQECIKKYEACKKFADKTCKENDFRTPGCILTYYDLEQKDMCYEKFDDEQQARSWAYANIHKIKEHFVYISDYEKFEGTKSKKLEFNFIELLNPVNMDGTMKNLKTKDPKKEKPEKEDPEAKDPVISHSSKGLFDSGSDVGVFPFDKEKMEPLIHSAQDINGQMEPIVFAKLRINGELLEGIHKVNMIAGGWYGFGVPQLQLMSECGALQIMYKMLRKILP